MQAPTTGRIMRTQARKERAMPGMLRAVHPWASAEVVELLLTLAMVVSLMALSVSAGSMKVPDFVQAAMAATRAMLRIILRSVVVLELMDDWLRSR